MIVFDLKCPHNHRFEAWFKSSSAYDEQLVAGHVSCPFCNSTDISKAPMAPNVSAKSNQKGESIQFQGAPHYHEMPQQLPEDIPSAKSNSPELQSLISQAQQMFVKIREHVEENCDNVGKDFAEEARKIHYGEAEERGIYGEATQEETLELIEEGVDIVPLPSPRRSDA